MVTLILIAITCLVSILCFTGTLNGNRLLFNAYSVWHRKEWHRMLSHGLVHGGWGHLLFKKNNKQIHSIMVSGIMDF